MTVQNNLVLYYCEKGPKHKPSRIDSTGLIHHHLHKKCVKFVIKRIPPSTEKNKHSNINNCVSGVEEHIS